MTGDRAGLRRAAPALALGLFGVSWSAVLVRLADAPAPSVAFWRLLLSVAILAPILVAGGQLRELRRLSAGDGLLLAGTGVVLSLHLTVWFLSLEYTSVAASTVLVTTHPLFVGVLSALWLEEAPGRAEWTGMVLAVAGAAWVGWGDLLVGPDPLLGDLLAVSAALLMALYFVLGRRLRARLSLWSYVVPVYAVAAAVAGLVVLGTGGPFAGWGLPTWGFLAAMALGPMLLGHTSFNWALEHVRAYVVSVVVLLEPVGATLLAVLVLGRGEVPGPATTGGGLAVLAGVWLSLRARSRAADPGRLASGGGEAG